MMYLELDLGVYKRLTGWPLDSKANPVIGADGLPTNREIPAPPGFDRTGKEVWLPSYGVRIPLAIHPQKVSKGLSSKSMDGYRMFEAGFSPTGFRAVPVFDENTTGRDFEDIWPCVTFRWSGDNPLSGASYIYHDPFRTVPAEASPVEVTNRRGDVIGQGFDRVQYRKAPEPWFPTYSINVWSKDPIELKLICDRIQDLFPHKGALKVVLADGTSHVCDMFLQRMTQMGGDEGASATQGPERQRGMGVGFHYLIEAYRDNTTDQFGTQDQYERLVSYQTIMEIDNIQGQLLTGPEDIFQRELSTL